MPGGATHRLAGATTGVLALPWLHVSDGQVPLVLALAVGGSAGWTSPDVDQTRLWHWIDRVTVTEWLPGPDPMSHRGVTHWFGLPVLAGLALYLTDPGWAWAGYAFLAGWASHIAADFLVGARSEFRPAGVPLLPWSAHAGLGFQCSGVVERLLAFAAALAFPLAVYVVIFGGSL